MQSKCKHGVNWICSQFLLVSELVSYKEVWNFPTSMSCFLQVVSYKEFQVLLPMRWSAWLGRGKGAALWEPNFSHLITCLLPWCLLSSVNSGLSCQALSSLWNILGGKSTLLLLYIRCNWNPSGVAFLNISKPEGAGEQILSVLGLQWGRSSGW